MKIRKISTTKNALYLRQRYEDRKTKGLCTNCGKCEVSGSQYCDNCKNKEKIYSQKIKDLAYEKYGGYVCSCCGEKNKQFLTIDHVNNDGYKTRQEIKHLRGIHWWLKKHNFPSGFQVLCFNCNSGRHINGGVCPHIDNTKNMIVALSRIGLEY